MAKRSKSGLKRKRQSVRRRLRNQGVQSHLKTVARQAAEQPDAVALAIAALDRAARKGIIHKNTAARKKSRLLKRTTAR